jgi:PAS domain S-box-containing protein
MLVLFDGEAGLADTWTFVESKLDFGLWLWDCDPRLGDWSRGLYGRAMQWSSGLYRLLGLEPASQPSTLSLLDSLTHPEDRISPNELEADLYSGAPFEREFRVVQPRGTMRRVLMRGECLRNAEGAVTRAIGVAVDVTERHATAVALQEAQQKFRALVGVLDHPVRISRKDGGVVDIFGWEKVTGQTVADSLGAGWSQAIHPDDLETTRKAWMESAERGEPYEIEHRLRTATGEYRWYRSKALAPFKVMGLPTWRVGISLDIHAHKLAEATRTGWLTGAQIRGARGILNWSLRDLAEATGISSATLRRLEETDGAVHLSEQEAARVVESLFNAGVELFFPSVGKPGVRPK